MGSSSSSEGDWNYFSWYIQINYLVISKTVAKQRFYVFLMAVSSYSQTCGKPASRVWHLFLRKTQPSPHSKLHISIVFKHNQMCPLPKGSFQNMEENKRIWCGTKTALDLSVCTNNPNFSCWQNFVAFGFLCLHLLFSLQYVKAMKAINTK